MKGRITVEDGKAMYSTDTLQYKSTMDSDFNNKRRTYIDSLKKNIRNRLRKEDSDVFSDLSKVLEPDTVKDTPHVECLKYRSSLKPEKLDILLKISMLGSDIQHFDPVPAVTRWRRVKTRRTGRLKEVYKPRKKAKTG
ncbi:hypothetical protein DPMN_137469 [Dreissena polymorpha]|uniref:Uncharacterized protein n=1 Tax=Dreissena polymorpha TaxID=45954 RepID=A0A9D4JDN9_DREPO|nr:hypothetical protein DPMN_137469 [Dreissena polymorpha]